MEKFNYQEQAEKFLSKNGIKLSIIYYKNDFYFPGDEETRDIYKFKISHNLKSYSGTFGQSIANKGKAPDDYDILSCLSRETPGSSFKDFCSNYGYDYDSRATARIYKNLLSQYNGIQLVIGNDTEDNQLWAELREIK